MAEPVALEISVNGARQRLTADPAMPLLWALRDLLHLTGTKFGCGIAQCGACTVLVDGVATRSCVTSLAAVGKANVTTIEGLSADGDHPLQQAWLRHDVVQCGYCQSGQLMTAAELIAANPEPDDAAIDAAMAGNLCRCGTYNRIRAAIKTAAAIRRGRG